MCRELRARAFLDDRYDALVGMQNGLTKPYFFLHEWNAHELSLFSSDAITVVRSWKQFYEELLALRELHEAVCFFNKIENKFTNVQKIADFLRRHSGETSRLLYEYRHEKSLLHV